MEQRGEKVTRAAKRFSGRPVLTHLRTHSIEHFASVREHAERFLHRHNIKSPKFSSSEPKATRQQHAEMSGVAVRDGKVQTKSTTSPRDVPEAVYSAFSTTNDGLFTCRHCQRRYSAGEYRDAIDSPGTPSWSGSLGSIYSSECDPDDVRDDLSNGHHDHHYQQQEQRHEEDEDEDGVPLSSMRSATDYAILWKTGHLHFSPNKFPDAIRDLYIFRD